MTVWRPPPAPAAPWRAQRPALLDLTKGAAPARAEPAPHPPAPAPPAFEPERDEALIAERDEARRQAKAATSAMKQAVATMAEEQRRRLAAEAEARALRRRVEIAEATARRAERFAAVARGALRPETFEAIAKMAAHRQKALPRAAGMGEDARGEPPVLADSAAEKRTSSP